MAEKSEVIDNLGETDKKNHAESLQQLPVTLEFGQWLYHIPKKRLSRNRTIYDLGRAQSRLLLFLCQHQGEVVSRDQLVKSVWQGKVVVDNSITVALASLRKLLGDDSKQPLYIETVQSLGYRFLPVVTAYPYEKNSPYFRFSYRLIAALLVSLFLILMVLFSGFTFKQQSQDNSNNGIHASNSRPLTSVKGAELHASYNAATNMLLFSHLAPNVESYSFELMVKSMTKELYVPLTHASETKAGDYLPELSPSGTRMLFNRSNLTTSCDYMLADFDAEKMQLANIHSILPCPKGQGGLQAGWLDEDNILLGYPRKRGLPQAIYRMNLITGELFPLTDIKNINGHGDYRFAYSKLTHQLAYLRHINDLNGTELWVVDLTNQNHKKLMTVAGFPYSVIWVNKGQHILVRSGYSEFSVVDLKGEISVVKSNIKSAISMPFAIVESKVGFMAGEEKNYDVYIQDLHTQSINDGLSSSFSDRSPVMAKSANVQAFVSKRDGLFQVWLARAEGLQQFTQYQHRINIQSLALSSPGDLLAYSANGAVTLLDDSGNQLFVNAEEASSPSFSLDGRFLYFASNRGILRLELDGLQLTQFLNRGYKPKAGENGTLYFIEDRQLFKASAEGGIKELMTIPESARLWNSNQYDVVDGQFYYAARVSNTLKLMRRPLTGGEDSVVTELYSEDFSLNNDASLMISSRRTNGETNLESIELTFP